MERLGLAPDGVLRIGLTHYNTRAEVDRLADELEAIAAGGELGELARRQLNLIGT